MTTNAHVVETTNAHVVETLTRLAAALQGFSGSISPLD
jgi:hypothetical protein